MKKYIQKIVIALGMVALPVFTFAGQAGGGYSTIGDALRTITTDIFEKGLIPLLLAIGLVVFLWGVVKYVTAGADESKAKEGRNLMIYGIIALFVMVSVWGLVNVLTQTLQLENKAPAVPQLSK
jgi:hypothetical protein